MAILMDGKALAQKIRSNLKIECDELKKDDIFPKLAVILVGENPASLVYVRNKNKACEEVGIDFEEYRLNADISQQELMNLIDKLNKMEDVHGILLQSPLPDHLDATEAFNLISPKKDVDGFNPVNMGRLVLGQDTFVSCTPFGVMKILEEYGINIEGKKVTLIGRSNIVGKPLLQCCVNKSATVTMCHSKTENLKAHTLDADIVIVAIGRAKFITADMIKEGAVVIDIGINRGEDGKIVGDVDFENVEKKAGFITPVPGGVGPMTIAMLMNNVIKAAKKA